MSEWRDANDVATQLGTTEVTVEIICPACGQVVPWVSSATWTLALWQHRQWVCPVRPKP